MDVLFDFLDKLFVGGWIHGRHIRCIQHVLLSLTSVFVQEYGYPIFLVNLALIVIIGLLLFFVLEPEKIIYISIISFLVILGLGTSHSDFSILQHWFYDY